MLYEHIVNIESLRCIELSELLEQSGDSLANMEKYLLKFRELKGILAKSRYPLKKQPLFQWHDRNSASWCFEEQRILNSLHAMLMSEAKKYFDKAEYSTAKNHLVRAVSVCKDMLQDWVKTPYIRGMPELQKPYILALLFRTMGTRCFNAHMNLTSPKVALMAYQYVELSNRLWKLGAIPEYENKLKAHYHHAVASTSEDFKEKISHSTEAVQIFDDATMLKDHEDLLQRNNSVHYETPEPVHVPLFSLEQACAYVFKVKGESKE